MYNNKIWENITKYINVVDGEIQEGSIRLYIDNGRIKMSITKRGTEIIKTKNDLDITEQWNKYVNLKDELATITKMQMKLKEFNKCLWINRGNV